MANTGAGGSALARVRFADYKLIEQAMRGPICSGFSPIDG